jgi:hypothetical protein
MRRKRFRCVCGKKFVNRKARKQHLSTGGYLDGCGTRWHTLDAVANYNPHSVQIRKFTGKN